MSPYNGLAKHVQSEAPGRVVEPTKKRRAHLTRVTAAEYLKAVHQAPVFFRHVAKKWQAVLLTRRRFVRKRVVSDDGEWKSEYIPILVRIRPVVWDDERGEFATEPKGRGAASPVPVDPELRTLLDRIERDWDLMAQAIERLDIAGLLIPVQMGFAFRLTEKLPPDLFMVDPAKFVSLPSEWLAALVSGSLTSLDIAIGSLYSMRLADGAFFLGGEGEFEARLAVWASSPLEAERAAAREQRQGQLPPVHFQIDATEMLDFSTVLDPLIGGN